MEGGRTEGKEEREGRDKGKEPLTKIPVQVDTNVFHSSRKTMGFIYTRHTGGMEGKTREGWMEEKRREGW